MGWTILAFALWKRESWEEKKYNIRLFVFHWSQSSLNNLALSFNNLTLLACHSHSLLNTIIFWHFLPIFLSTIFFRVFPSHFIDQEKNLMEATLFSQLGKRWRRWIGERIVSFEVRDIFTEHIFGINVNVIKKILNN